MAKFDAIHHRINTNTGHTVNEDTLGPLFAHFVADLRTALDRMMLVLRASCTADKFLPADIDVRDVAFWYAGKLDQNHPTPAKQPRERAQVAAKKIIVFDENDERADEYNRAVQVLVDSWLEVQAFQEIAPNGDRNFVPLDTEEERKNDYMSLRRQFAYLHFLRNFTAHRGRVIPVTSKGYLCIDRVTMKRELKDVPTNDKNVEVSSFVVAFSPDSFFFLLAQHTIHSVLKLRKVYSFTCQLIRGNRVLVLLRYRATYFWRDFAR